MAKVWHTESIPKVNSFIWILLHNKLLTAENLRKRGINGPSRCALCNSDEETISHLFLHCNFSLLVWRSVLPPGMALNFPDSVVQLFADWSKYFPGSLIKKPILSRLWASIPKNLCWQLWIARNKAIFKDQKAVPSRIGAKTIGMAVEKFASSNINFPVKEAIPDPYSTWGRNFLKERSPLKSKKIINGSDSLWRPLPWEIHLPSKDFKKWLREKNSFALFFDGTLKGNPRVARAGGDPFGSRRTNRTNFCLGFRDSN